MFVGISQNKQNTEAVGRIDKSILNQLHVSMSLLAYAHTQ